jgi:hypothetical protein
MFDNLRRKWPLLASATVITCCAALSSVANATVILTFGQAVDGTTVTATNDAADTSTNIVGTDIPVIISQYAGAGAPISAFLDFDINSTAPVTLLLGQLLQPFGGAFSFTSQSGGGGINYLSSVFTDFVFGINGGSSLTLNASEPPGSVVFTSDVLDVGQLIIPRAISLAFADVTPPGAILGTTLGAFASSVSGTMSALIHTDIPEPSALVLLGVGLGALGLIRRRRGATGRGIADCG